MSSDLSKAGHTIVVSDIHVADVEPSNPKKPLWKRFKWKEQSVEGSFKRFLSQMMQRYSGSLELVLNGDIFDFDSVMTIPKSLDFSVNWLERRRGMNAAEPKSRMKMRLIMRDNPVFFGALKDWVLRGNRLVFIIGNHDMELHWPSVQSDIRDHLNLPSEFDQNLRFCEWFYISNHDTLIEHGNQYDEYCLCANPINPLIKKGKNVFVRLPFGNLANKYVLNGMGLFNPHVDSTWIKDTVWEYVVFFYRYQMRVQPFLLFQWFWAAVVTFFYSLTEALLPALSDPLALEARIQSIAQKSNASPAQVIALRELSVHPAGYQPFRVLRELWLDRVFFFGAIIFLGFQFFSLFNIFGLVSAWWFWGPVMIFLPIFIFYAHSVESEIQTVLRNLVKTVPSSAKIAGVSRVIHGHTHIEQHTVIQGIEHLNTGTWSPAYEDLECTKPYGRKCFAVISPDAASGGRRAELYEWKDTEAILIQKNITETKDLPKP